MMIRKFFRENILPFLPILLIYLAAVLIFSPDGLKGDGPRYLKYAENITQGFYADVQDPSIRNGPGYPLAISIPVLLNMPYIVIRLMNILFVGIALVYFYKTLSIYLRKRKALFFCYALGLYPVLVRTSTRLLSECLSILFVCGFLYYFIRLIGSTSPKKKDLILSSVFLGGLALTKFIFGYVIVALLAAMLLIYIFKRSNKIKVSMLTLLFSFLICTPYLVYTYSVTNKVFLWGTGGGEILYWRSTPFQKEYGNWVNMQHVLDKNIPTDFYDTEDLSTNHKVFIESLVPLSYLERDRVFKEKALENIQNYPLSYIKNTGVSLCRMFFNYPFSYTEQKPSTFFYIIPNMFLLVFLIVATFIALIKFKTLPFEIVFFGVFALIFIGGLSLLDGRGRHLIPIVPFLLVFISYIINRFITLNLNSSSTSRQENIP